MGFYPIITFNVQNSKQIIYDISIVITWSYSTEQDVVHMLKFEHKVSLNYTLPPEVIENHIHISC